ncbi:alpha/beta fold hydrolase [Seohaeicola saemankumensis]|nr:alpha/beta fold hydrolase [Seohaeicola saemankumensis]MCA0870266.1 alpha/beta fold hydrolase [Seohaeicola saemankumensis]
MKRRLAAIVAADMVGYSRLMEADEAGTLARHKSHRADLIDPAVHGHGGRIVKTTGDGLILTFDSAADAVACAIHIQSDMVSREADQTHDDRIQYRVGVNIGDAMLDQGDIFGDCVNIAARLESLAEPGAVCISDTVHQLLPTADTDRFDDLGLQRIKNISRALRVWQWSPLSRDRLDQDHQAETQQRISFCTAPDGVQLAWASTGSGPPVFKSPNWMNHLDYDWRTPIHGPLYAGLARRHRLVRFDQRGNGLSDWEVETFSEDAMIQDMETVVQAAGLDRFILFGQSQGCAYSIRYAAENPDRVAGLVLLGGFLRGPLRRGSKEQADLHEATQAIIRQGWGSPNPAYRHLFTESLMPGASPQQKAFMDEKQRLATSPENAARINDMNARVDVTALAATVTVPTIVFHAEGDQRVPLAEGRRMAAALPGAEFVTLPGNNHILVEGTDSFDQFLSRFETFCQQLNT